MTEKKILYFDYWTVGINNFLFFHERLKAEGFTAKLVHLNSWRQTPGPDYQQINGIDCYDIRYFKTNAIFKVLEAERPLAVVMLNASYLTDRTVILACRRLGIKSVFLAHGSLTRESFIESSIASFNKSAKKNRLKKSIKHLKGTVWNYLYTIALYDKKLLFTAHPYAVLVKAFLNPAKYLMFPPHAFDLEPDLALVYGNAERDFLSNRFVNKSAVKVIGFPGLDKFFLELPRLGEGKEAFFRENNIPDDVPYVTYIDEGMVIDKIWTQEDHLEFLDEISSLCDQAGYHLVVKLHPRTTSGPHRASYNSLKNTTVIDDTNFAKLIYFTEKCVSHYSTTFIYPMVLDKPIIVPAWGRSTKVSTLYTDKEVTFAKSPEELVQYLQQKSFYYDRTGYLRDFVPFQDGKTKERIVHYITELIK